MALDVLPLLGEPTGIGMFCRGLVETLATRDDVAPVGYAVTWRSRSRITPLLPAGVPLGGTPMPARLAHLGWRASSLPRYEWFGPRVQVVHGTNYTVPPTQRAASVVTIFDLSMLHYPELCEPATRAYPRLIERAIDAGAFVHTAAHFVAEEIIERFAVSPERMRVVPLGLFPARPRTPAARAEAASRLSVLPAGSPYLLALGTVEPRKDLPSLVRAMPQVLAAVPEMSLVIAGRDGWGVAALEEALSEIAPAVAARVHRLGYVGASERDELLRGATMLVYPSLYEGFGIPPLEAMRAGVPVVASDAGSIPEVVGDAAVLVEPRDAGELGAAIVALLHDETRRAVLIERGLDLSSQYTWQRCADGMVACYHDAVKATR